MAERRVKEQETYELTTSEKGVSDELSSSDLNGLLVCHCLH
jgi:hypothetical protein